FVLAPRYVFNLPVLTFVGWGRGSGECRTSCTPHYRCPFTTIDHRGHSLRQLGTIKDESSSRGKKVERAIVSFTSSP
ncbi:MAG: hypothetical protein AAFU78_23615, partial [Cyanobacteria bacterium J06633_2]